MKIKPIRRSVPNLWNIIHKIACLGTLAGLSSVSASAATVYWDSNTAVAGFTGTASTGVWNTSAF